jgi:hypothetical protein
MPCQAHSRYVHTVHVEARHAYAAPQYNDVAVEVTCRAGDAMLNMGQNLILST